MSKSKCKIHTKSLFVDKYLLAHICQQYHLTELFSHEILDGILW